jgi:hypothetical protein
VRRHNLKKEAVKGFMSKVDAQLITAQSEDTNASGWDWAVACKFASAALRASLSGLRIA